MLSITIFGNVSRVGDLREVGDTCVINFTVATNNRYTNSDGERICDTTFVRVAAWGGLAEQVIKPYVKVGDTIAVYANRFGGTRRRNEEGDFNNAKAFVLDANAYLSEGDEPRSSFEIVARDVELHGSSGSGPSGGNAAKPKSKAKSDEDEGEVAFNTF